MMTVIKFKMHCHQLLAGMTHLRNITNSDVPDVKECEVGVEDSLYTLHQKMKSFF